MRTKIIFGLIFLELLFIINPLNAENGYRLWLRYNYIKDSVLLKDYRQKIQNLVVLDTSIIRGSIINELEIGLSSMLGKKPAISNKIKYDNTLVITTKKETFLKDTVINNRLKSLGPEGFIVQSVFIEGKKCIAIVANSEIGNLYGTFKFLQLLQMGQNIDNLSIVSKPRIQQRILNHWDNLDGSIERGYAGTSLWYGTKKVSNERMKDYARANASIGINGVVINNVNASPKILSAKQLHRAAEIANIFRPYGIKLYLSVNFSSPDKLGKLPTSDPIDSKVQIWWKSKVKEIYGIIPDFGGFLVKANSEGLPGPQDFGRTHADGANMLANALDTFGGIVMWRAFVYSPSNDDRAKQGYNEFKPLNGKFASNVLIQVKNGPIDFQPREPFHPLFGAMNKTTLSLELQITQEYLGQSEHLVYLAPLYKEVLESDTYANEENSTVGRVIDGSLYNDKVTAIAGVANTGNSTNWCNLHFAQANWFAFGLLAWDYTISSEDIANEWISLTFSTNKEIIKTIKKIMLPSREACVNYMTPLGLHHIMGYNHHRGPQPWLDNAARFDWNSIYYHRADSIGVGFDRTKNGSNQVSQYFPPLCNIFNNIDSCPEKYLLWFHHVKWDFRLKSGRTLWNELCYKYNEGVDTVIQMQQLWKSLDGKIDVERFDDVSKKLDIQLKEAIWWKNACLLYFQSFSKMPFPEELEIPKGSLRDYQKKDYSPYRAIN